MAAFELYADAGAAVRGTVARAARSLNATHLDREDIDALALDVCMAMPGLSRSWDPAGGALPWVWAHRRVLTLVSSYVGQYAETLEDELPAELQVHRADLDDVPDEVALARLSRRDPLCALLLDALTAIVSDRDLRVVLLYAVQQLQGDPSPSHTVAEAVGLEPGNVRQIVSRTRRRLIEMVDTEARFEGLASIAFLGLSEAPRAA